MGGDCMVRICALPEASLKHKARTPTQTSFGSAFPPKKRWKHSSNQMALFSEKRVPRSARFFTLFSSRFSSKYRFAMVFIQSYFGPRLLSFSSFEEFKRPSFHNCSSKLRHRWQESFSSRLNMFYLFLCFFFCPRLFLDGKSICQNWKHR